MDGSQLPKGDLSMKRLFMFCLIAIVSLATLPISAMAAPSATDWLDASESTAGLIAVNYPTASTKTIKLVVEKGSTAKYVYDLRGGKTEERFLLQSGSGQYTVALMEHVKGNQYRRIDTRTLEVKIARDSDVFLHATQMVDWQAAEKTVAQAQALVKDKKTDKAKAEAIRSFIVAKVAYDYELAKTPAAAKSHSLDDTLVSGKAICYGYAGLIAGMLRSSGIPTKVVFGTTSTIDGPHAWNEAYIDGKWQIIDATVDYAYAKSKKTAPLFKDASQYKAEQVY